MTDKIKLNDLTEIVERDIVKLFKAFHDNPAIFLSESDVECYLYSLLVHEPDIRDFRPDMKNFSAAVESSKSLLVHANMRINIKNRDRIVDFSIFQPKETLDWSKEECWKNMIGIEIKFNRRAPARKEPSNIIEDVKKVSDYKKGYILWLNWDRMIDDDHLNKVEKLIEKYDNIKLFYLDIFSNPIKTNLKEL